MSQHYKLVEDSPHQLVFKDADLTWLMVLSTIVGIPMLLGGVIYAVCAYVEGSPIGIPLIMLGFGLAVVSILFLFTMHNENPKYIIFDNEKGRIELKGREKDEEAWIPYEDVLGFGIREWMTSSSSGSTRPSNVNYQVYWQKKDGGRWDLAYFSKPEDAEELYWLLNDFVDLDKVSAQHFVPQLPYQVHYEVGSEMDSDKELLYWRNPIENSLLTGTFAAAGFVLTGIGWMQTSIEKQESIWLGALFVGLASLFLVLFLYTIFTTLTTKYSLSIGKEKLCLSEEGWNGKVVQKEIALCDITSIHFGLNRDVGGTKLEIASVNRCPRLMHEEEPEGPVLEAVGTLIEVKDRTCIKVVLSVIERVHFEALIQDVIAKKGGYEVL